MILSPPPVCWLFDNGSLRADSTLSLRRVAAALAARTGREVRAVSLRHSDRVPAAELNGVKARLLEPALQEWWEGRTAGPMGTDTADLLPLFFGPSSAVTEYVPVRVRALREIFPGVRVRLAPCLVDPSDGSDRRVARMLADQMDAAAKAAGWQRPKVLLTDHGSPTRAVSAVRDHLGAQLREELAERAAMVGVASMERRAGSEYDFNAPLLAAALDAPPFDCGEVVVALQFLSPGRHAGPEGDIAEICRAAEAARPERRIRLTEPLSAHPQLVEVLADRLGEAREQETG